MKLFLLILLSFILSNNSKEILDNQLFNSLSKNYTNEKKQIPDDFIDLIYYKLISESLKDPQNNYRFEYKIFLTDNISTSSNSFNVKWSEIVNGRDYSQNIIWQQNFHNQLLYLLNEGWLIDVVLNHSSEKNNSQSIYIIKKIIRNYRN